MRELVISENEVATTRRFLIRETLCYELITHREVKFSVQREMNKYKVSVRLLVIPVSASLTQTKEVRFIPSPNVPSLSFLSKTPCGF